MSCPVIYASPVTEARGPVILSRSPKVSFMNFCILGGKSQFLANKERPMREVTAFRTIGLILPDSSEEIYTISFSKPYKLDDGVPCNEDWHCDVSLTGPGYSETMEAPGADSMQAIHSAFQFVRPLVQILVISKHAKITYCGENVDISDKVFL
jgi:hypothetical protein